MVPLDMKIKMEELLLQGFWKSFQNALGNRLDMSTAYHPQTDGQSERTIQTLEDMLRACVMDFKGSWIDNLQYVEFVYNNSFQSSIGMAPYEALYGRPCRSPLCWAEAGEKSLLGPETLQEATQAIQLVKDRLRASQSRQKSYTDVRRRPLEFELGEHVFLKVSPRDGIKRFGKKGKLTPRYIGPFEITQRIGEVAYRLALPEQLAGIYNVFHVSMLKKYHRDPSHIIEWQNVELNEDASYETKPVGIIDSDTRELRSKKIKRVKVLWQHHGADEATWELESEMREKYPELFSDAN